MIYVRTYVLHPRTISIFVGLWVWGGLKDGRKSTSVGGRRVQRLERRRLAAEKVLHAVSRSRSDLKFALPFFLFPAGHCSFPNKSETSRSINGRSLLQHIAHSLASNSPEAAYHEPLRIAGDRNPRATSCVGQPIRRALRN